MNKRLFTLGMIVLLIAVVVFGRLMEHVPNFTPVAAVAIFAGFLFRSKALAMIVPLAGMAIVDLLFIGTYNTGTMLIVWAALCLPALLGGWLRKPVRIAEEAPRWKKAVLRMLKVFVAAGAASVLFFVATNLAVWAFDGLYAQNWAGLSACFASAIPFFKGTLAGNMAFAFAFFGAYELARVYGKAYAPGLSLR